jgi:lactoylglutathione lyase
MSPRFAYTGIRVRDMDESVRFYTEILGMEIVEPIQSTPPTHGKVAGLRSPGSAQLLELNWYEPGTRFGRAYANGEELDHLAFECEDVGATVAELERKGVEVLIRPREIGAPQGWNEAFVKDPNGIWLELVPRTNKG